MDFLLVDESGNVPLVEQRVVQKDEWITLNAPSMGIPMEAMDHRARRPDVHRPTGPTGVYLEMEWALDTDWYDRDASWRPYIPLKPDVADGGPLSKSQSDWFFSFDMTTPYEHLSADVFVVPEATREQIHEDIITWAWCVDDICSNHPFPPETAQPPEFDHGTLVQAFSSLEDLQAAGCVCKRTAVDYLGFLSWWNSSVLRWDANLDHQAVAVIRELGLHRFRKRGVLIDLERDWQEINLPNLLRHQVPIAYFWSPTLAALPRFTGLSPHVLVTYDALRRSLARELYSNDLPDLASDFAVIERFDHYFQDACIEGRPDPDAVFDDDWSYYVVDFQGWSQRQIPLRVARHYYLLFGSSIGKENDTNFVLFRRWESLGNLPVDQPLPVGTMEDVDMNGIVRETGEIRELHKFHHAPVGSAGCALGGRPQRPSNSSDGSLKDGLSRRRSWGPTDFASRRWLRQMTDGQRRSASSSSDNGNRGVWSPRPSSRLSSDVRSRNRSASPRPRTYHHQRESPPPTFTVARQRAVARLQECCAVITHTAVMWSMPPDAEWDSSFLNGSFLLFPDEQTLTRLRYWAVCDPGTLDVRRLLELAISRNMKFIMATRLGDLRVFKPASTPELSELTKRTYEVGFQEEHLKDVNGGAAFRDQYMGKLADILRRPHARALICMGGPTAWIAKHYGGPSLVQQFLDGPSTQVTIHHRGAVTSSPFCDDTLFHDQVSAQEENLVHGFVSAENPDHHRWLFPTTEIMDEYCHHWRGEWTVGCDLILSNIAKALERGTAKLLTRKGWKSYLHSTNHGERRPGIVLTPAHFAKADELLRGFSDVWNGKRVADIVLPVRFDPSAANQGGFVADAQI